MKTKLALALLTIWSSAFAATGAVVYAVTRPPVRHAEALDFLQTAPPPPPAATATPARHEITIPEVVIMTRLPRPAARRAAVAAAELGPVGCGEFRTSLAGPGLHWSRDQLVRTCAGDSIPSEARGHAAFFGQPPPVPEWEWAVKHSRSHLRVPAMPSVGHGAPVTAPAAPGD